MMKTTGELKKSSVSQLVRYLDWMCFQLMHLVLAPFENQTDQWRSLQAFRISVRYWLCVNVTYINGIPK